MTPDLTPLRSDASASGALIVPVWLVIPLLPVMFLTPALALVQASRRRSHAR